MGVCRCGGNLNASAEIIGREKKFSRFVPKMVHILDLLANSAPSLVLLHNLFDFASLCLD
jgi:hypothetical protein